jgi:hypothetical protein
VPFSLLLAAEQLPAAAVSSLTVQGYHRLLPSQVSCRDPEMQNPAELAVHLWARNGCELPPPVFVDSVCVKPRLQTPQLLVPHCPLAVPAGLSASALALAAAAS